MAFLDVDQPKTLGDWVIWLAAMGVLCTSGLGAMAVIGSLREELIKRKVLKEKEANSRSLSQALYYAKKRKLVKFEKEGDKLIMVLTEKGKKRKLQYDWENIKISKTDKWDRKWRLLMFDIPHKQKGIRDDFRRKLVRLGLIQFQKSVWIYPYPFENELDFVSEVLGVSQYLQLLTVTIENDQQLRTKFCIS
ncbi:MAG: hypothetical protein A3B23_03915 [Candidatus Colwellbacteria bacterium RIFCSPLOWO2_01_FULL_48_10]|uniref:Transcriptional repressor PaaX-like central Cas2-like domain-containing protein n=1 Tax=Candidatus Colwellbacteria bacterium RIFCSPLOWO2_01_FULL_48_10 TaxID=1797690 RepID=A0A1G1Z8Z4_9BACT|nr:MAG: hypothetical protein A3B23_03915 [Candidatus Colwellbacteria bacterium RIFCSPLOWO2_01_FULL_48_10]